MSQVLVPMILTNVPGLDAGTDRTHVRVERSDRHRHARGQADLACHVGRQMAGQLIGRQRRCRVMVSDLSQCRIESPQECLAGQTTPAVVIHRLVPGGTDASRQTFGSVLPVIRPERSPPIRPRNAPPQRRRARFADNARFWTSTIRSSRRRHTWPGSCLCRERPSR